MSAIGKLVYLIGAGPGDPGLISVKGAECLAKADVIVYDYLSNPRLLSHCRPDAEKIYVGKKGSRHTLEQPSGRPPHQAARPGSICKTL